MAGLGRVPKGKAFWNISKGKVVKGGQFMSKNSNNYLELFKKNQPSNKIPRTNTSTNPSSVDRSMEKMLKDWGRAVKYYLNGGAPGG